jgi:hypothetical protein
MLEQLARITPGLLADSAGLWFLDIDDTIRKVHGYHKQAAARGYSKVFGLNLQAAVISTPQAAPLVVGCRLRRGNTWSGRGSPQLAARAAQVARRLGAAGQGLLRADSAYYQGALAHTAIRAGLWFSITARHTTAVMAAIAAIPDDAWTAIHYTKAVWDPDQKVWVSDAEVAETRFTAFKSRGRTGRVDCRLVVRRVTRLGDAPEGQDPLFAAYRYHAFITNSTLTAIEADRRHRDHAIVEQVFAELKAAGWAHLPSGQYTANALWACSEPQNPDTVETRPWGLGGGCLSWGRAARREGVFTRRSIGWRPPTWLLTRAGRSRTWPGRLTCRPSC